MSEWTLPEGACAVVACDVLSTELGSEHVILHPGLGMYYGVEDVAAEVWKLLQTPVSLEDLCRAICDSYEVEVERCRRDVQALLAELGERGLIDIVDQQKINKSKSS